MDITKAGAVTEREDEGVVVEINDEAGNPAFGPDGTTRVTITVVGTYSKRYRAALEANRRWWRKHVGRTKPTDQQIEAQALELMAASIISWQGFTAGGADYPFTKANAVALFDQAPWIREQVETAMSDHEGFFTTGSAR